MHYLLKHRWLLLAVWLIATLWQFCTAESGEYKWWLSSHSFLSLQRNSASVSAGQALCKQGPSAGMIWSEWGWQAALLQAEATIGNSGTADLTAARLSLRSPLAQPLLHLGCLGFDPWHVSTCQANVLEPWISPFHRPTPLCPAGYRPGHTNLCGTTISACPQSHAECWSTKHCLALSKE